MTEPTGPAGAARPAPDAAPDAAPSALEDYLRTMRGSYTEEALRRSALAAGHQPADVDAALAATRQSPVTADRGRVARNIVLAYLAAFAVLAVLIILNPANQGRDDFLGDVRWLGVIVLAIGLGAGLFGSFVWLTSRRFFWALAGAGAVLYGLSMVRDASTDGLVLGVAAILGGGAIVVAAAVLNRRPGVPASPSVSLLMSVPLLILLVVGGICVASGLPIARPA